MLKKLNRTTTNLPQARPVKVLQFGAGNFLRGFADWMIDILNEKTNFNGAIQVIQSISQGAGSGLADQEGLYHVVVSGIKSGKTFRETRLITSVAGTINPKEDFAAFIEIAKNPDLQFVISNTTEAGISFNEKDSDPGILSSSFPGKVTALLFHRYTYFNGSTDKGLIFLPCELIEKNGETLKSIILQYAAHWKLTKEFSSWISDHNTFCNTIVDRIVPGFPKEIIKDIREATGYEDNLVVMAEPFYSWIIEAPLFVQSKFPVKLAKLDVQFANSLVPYRTRKVRILNGAHTTLVPVAYLKGLRTVRESIEDPSVGNYLRKAIFEEIVPTLDLPPDELRKFADDVIERFLNPSIRHELISISLNSISKFKVRVLPSILRYIEIKHEMPQRLLFSLAALIRFYKGSWESQTVPLNDTPEVLSFFKAVWLTGRSEDIVQKTLANKSFWGRDLNQTHGLYDCVAHHLAYIESHRPYTLPE
ncbi:tagaturonate reductase [soil metagenome]